MQPLLTAPFRWLRQRLDLPIEPASPLEYRPGLIAYVSFICIAAVIASALSWTPITDIGTLLVGAIAITAISASAVRAISGSDVRWSPVVFAHLALTLALGPPGAVAGAIADGLVGRSLVATGWFRSIFNTALFALTNLAAWWVAHLFLFPLTPTASAFAGLIAGVAAWMTNYLLLAIVIFIASRRQVSVADSMQSGLATLPHTLAYGCAAGGVTLLYRVAGVWGFGTSLLPVLSAQAFLVLLARRTNAQQRELRLAEERERRRIARDLHDSVVQVVVGYSMRLSAGSLNIEDELGIGAVKWASLMDKAASDLRQAAQDLRTLIIRIAPPSLDEEGLAPSLRALLSPLVEVGIQATLDVPEPLQLDTTDRELVFRVVQEALRNVITHAGADQVEVTVSADSEAVVLTVVDNGKGFSQEELRRRRREGHVGTRGLEEVAAERGATLTIDSVPGEGTRLCMNIPVTQVR